MTEEELAFDPTMKKKKKKKAVDLETNEQSNDKTELTENIEQPDVDSGVALENEMFSKDKKKKKESQAD